MTSSISRLPSNTLRHQDAATEKPLAAANKPVIKMAGQPPTPPAPKLIIGQHQRTLPSSSNPNPIPLLSFFTALITSKLSNPPLPSSVDPELVLAGNFAPVDETPPTDCSVVHGQLPSSLDGVYIRNGPNPHLRPRGLAHHLFDGDGMLHSIRLSRGRATFCSRYVQSYKLKLERENGCAMIPSVFSGFYCLADVGRLVVALARVVTGRINLAQGFGLANTSVALFCNTLFAMIETDRPYAIRLTENGDIETTGRFDFGGEAPINMTAHPKVDSETGEVFSFQFFPFFPYLTFFRFDSNGSKRQKVPIFSMKKASYIHDFALTKRYAIFPESQLEVSAMNLMALKGMPMKFRPTAQPRIGIIPRNAESDSEMRWFTVPGFNAFHIINAWEEEDEDSIVLVVPRALSLENFLGRIEKVHFSLQKLRINMKSGAISSTLLSERSLELGSINAAYLGKKNRYLFMAVAEAVPKMSGVVKIDLESGREVASRSYGPGCFGGEALFVARDGAGDEDDGFVVSYVHNEMANESQFVVMDAKSPALEVVAAVRLPGRVPYGFHGLFVGEKQLETVEPWPTGLSST
ncbi:probable carotenoid cleavage dioxygenase 4, chloroplastic [Diospyros lotus]|uniref:probable carotenoid cleavage dioxygenase 4, chloroplastic n=1 Tax=Diospyros lotus TaxID=55363 RepID=UPI0022552FB2|nr:probable carotenoid cleavage dioxygenase 4, chloroplastic [Diospyros lotus]